VKVETCGASLLKIIWWLILKYLRINYKKKKIGDFNEDDVDTLKFFLDLDSANQVQIVKWNNFVELFGPLKGNGEIPNCVAKAKSLLLEEWFGGYMSHTKAQQLLFNEPIYTFVSRISQNEKKVYFAITVVRDVHKMADVFVLHKDNMYFIGNCKTGYPTIQLLIQHNTHIFKVPFSLETQKPSEFIAGIDTTPFDPLAVQKMESQSVMLLWDSRQVAEKLETLINDFLKDKPTELVNRLKYLSNGSLRQKIIEDDINGTVLVGMRDSLGSYIENMGLRKYILTNLDL